MTFASLAVRNLARNTFRMVLTVAGVAVAIVAFLLLRTVSGAWTSQSESAASDRVVTRHKVTFVMELPRRYVEDIRQAPHIKETTWANWFGGKDPKHDHEFFATLAVDPATYFDVYPEIQVPAAQLDAFKHDRQGMIVGDVIAAKLGWKVGDRVTLQSGLHPGDWQFTVDGIYLATAKSIDRSTVLFQWDYLNDAVAPGQRDQVGWLISRVDNPSHIADVSVALDQRFEDRETPTLSQDERTFSKGFLAMFSAILGAMDIVSAVILIIMTLILGNTIAMGVRERTSEYGVLKAIGFLPRHIALWIVGESLFLGLLGGLVGLAIAWPFINFGIGRFVEENMGAMFPYFRLDVPNAILALALAGLLGVIAAAIPAWSASRLHVIDAVRRVA
jgi:putative ABC transport system permease protein